MGIVSPSPGELLANTIAFGVPSVVFFIMRMLNSVWVLKKSHLEDYLMCVTFCFYLSMLTFINISASYNSNLYPPEQNAAILANPSDVQNRILGSKLVIPLEQSMLLSTWGVKTCIWLFLRRLCRQLPKFQHALTILIIYIWFGYFIIQICYYAIFCRPFSEYWAVPVENQQCATYSHYSYVQMIFNITSDLALIAIPLRMFYIARLPLKRKVVLMAVFSMALFTIIAAVLNKAFNFLSPMTTTYQLWYIREASVAIWVGNLICCWQLFQRIFKIRTFDNTSDNIVAQPEMTARAHAQAQPSQYSAGGHPKTDSWYTRARENMRKAAPATNEAVSSFYGFLSKATRSYNSQPSRVNRMSAKGTVTDNSTLTGDTAYNEKPVGEPATLMTLDRDGDDATTAIEYRNQEGIF